MATKRATTPPAATAPKARDVEKKAAEAGVSVTTEVVEQSKGGVVVAATVERLSVSEMRQREAQKTADRLRLYEGRIARKSSVFEYRRNIDDVQPTFYVARSTSGGWYRISMLDVQSGLASLDPETGFGWREFSTRELCEALDAAMSLKFGVIVQDDEGDSDGDAVLEGRRRVRKKKGEKKERTTRSRPLRITPDNLSSIRAGFREHKHLARRDLTKDVWVSACFVVWAMERGAPRNPGTTALLKLCEERTRGLTVFPLPLTDSKMIAALREVVAPFQSPTVEQLRERYGVIRYEWAALLDGQLSAHGATPPKPPASRKAATVPVAKKSKK